MREAHGTVTFSINGNILELEGTGPWNLEQMKQSGDAAAPILKQLLDSPWAVLGTFHGEAFYTEDAVEQLVEWIKKEKQRGRVATALILTHARVPDMAKWHLSQIYLQAGEMLKIFDDRAQAVAWLEQQLAEPQSA